MLNSDTNSFSFSGLSNPYIINSFINWVIKGSFSYPNISKLSLCSNTFSGLGIFSISNSPVLWTKFSGLSNPYIINWLINWVFNGSFSKAIISILSTWLNIFSGLWISDSSISPVFWTIFSGLSNPYIINSLINWVSKGSVSKAIIAMLSTWLNIFSGLSISNNSISPVFWTIFSGLGVFSISNSVVFCIKFSGFSKPYIINSLINWVVRGSFSYPNISKLSFCSNTFSGLGVFSISNSPVLCNKFSGFSNP